MDAANRVYSIAWAKALTLWEEDVAADGDSMATAIASIYLCTSWSNLGKDKIGTRYFVRGRQIMLQRGMFDPEAVDTVYRGHGAEVRAVTAWGFYTYMS